MDYGNRAVKPQHPEPVLTASKRRHTSQNPSVQSGRHTHIAGHPQTPWRSAQRLLTVIVWVGNRSPAFTFLVHCLTVLTSSQITMSTHFWHGSLILLISRFTMVSKAMSGVKRPVLSVRHRERERTDRPRTTEQQQRRKIGRKKMC